MHQSLIRHFLPTVAAILACICPSFAIAQAYPAKPVQLVLGYSPGGGADALARLLAKGLSESTGQAAIVENRPGASALLAIEKVVKAPSDGYTLLVMASSSLMVQALNPKQPYDVERDLAPVSMVAIQPLVLLVNANFPAKNVKEFIALAKARPGSINYGSSGTGGASHLAGELFNLMADVKLFHVPYKGGGQSVTAAASGEIQATFASTTSARALLDAGRLRALAVTSKARTALLPSAPSLSEAGLTGYDSVVWYSVMAPASISNGLAANINALMGKVVNDPKMKQPFFNQGLEPLTGSIQELKSTIRNELAQNAKIIKAAGLKAP